MIPKKSKVMYHPPIKEHNEISSEAVKIEPEEGKLLLFPAYLYHSVEENLSDDERIVISFNINIARANQQIIIFKLKIYPTSLLLIKLLSLNFSLIFF